MTVPTRKPLIQARKSRDERRAGKNRAEATRTKRFRRRNSLLMPIIMSFRSWAARARESRALNYRLYRLKALLPALERAVRRPQSYAHTLAPQQPPHRLLLPRRPRRRWRLSHPHRVILFLFLFRFFFSLSSRLPGLRAFLFCCHNRVARLTRWYNE